MHIETNRAIVIYGVGYVSTVTLLTPFFYKYGSSGLLKAITKSMISYESLLWPVFLPRIVVDLMLIPVFHCLYYNRSLR